MPCMLHDPDSIPSMACKQKENMAEKVREKTRKVGLLIRLPFLLGSLSFVKSLMVSEGILSLWLPQRGTIPVFD